MKLIRSVYTKEEFELLEEKGLADKFSATGKPQVRDSKGSWRDVVLVVCKKLGVRYDK